MIYLGNLYKEGLEVVQDCVKTCKCYEQAAALGNSLAKFYLAYLYEYGLGVQQDYTKALELYTQAAEQGDINATNKLIELEQKLTTS